jgi:phosphatidylglycerol:prolipoprotein diacylglycerol transferase
LILLGFFFLWLKKRQTFPGQMLVAYLATYPILRSINEMFRGDSERGFFMDGPLSNAQFISVVIVAIALVVWFKVGRASKEPKAA